MTASKFLLLFLSIVITHVLAAQWNYSPSQNTFVDTGLNKKSTYPEMISDGNGGYFIAWMKSRPNSFGTDIFAQRISANGTRLWSDTGKLICSAGLDQNWPRLISDGADGIIITWQDSRAGFVNSDIYAQRVNGAGNIMWAVDGVPVFNVLNVDEVGPEIVSDNNGGAIICCWRTGIGSFDIYAQRLDASGTKLWATNGLAISAAASEQSYAKITTDGAGGAIICWRDFRNSAPPQISDIFAQRVNAAGTVQWIANGISVCTMPYDQRGQQIIPDNNGGAYITWEDYRASTPSQSTIDIYAQHIGSDGSPLWAVNGLQVCGAANNQQAPDLIMDESNGVIIAWHDARTVPSSVYAQKMTAAGAPAWSINGISVCSNTNNPVAAPFVASDGNNGAFICWEDKRTGADKNVFAQHINAAGVAQWATDGVAVCNAPNNQLFNIQNGQINGAVVRSGSGTAVLVWEDGRVDPFNGNHDIYISQIADPPTFVPLFINVNGKCQNAASARGKLLNPPSFADIVVTLDGNPVTYSPADSSFEYFTAGTTSPGNHIVRVRFSNFAGFTQKDSNYTVTASPLPTIAISGVTTVNPGQSTTLSASITNGGPGPLLQWADSTSAAGWTIIPGANNPTLVYTPPFQSNTRIRCELLSNANCANPNPVNSNTLQFTINLVTSIDPVSANAYGIRYFPNPAKQILIIDSLKLSDNWITADLVSMDGKKIKTIAVGRVRRLELGLNGLPAGQYTVVLRSRNGQVVPIRFMHF